MAQYYFTVYDDGSTAWAYTDAEPMLSKPGSYVTYAEYAVVYAANRETAYQQEVVRATAEVERTKKVRDAYVLMGVDAVTAGSMSGYTASVAALAEHDAGHDAYVAVRPTPAEVAAGHPTSLAGGSR